MRRRIRRLADQDRRRRPVRQRLRRDQPELQDPGPDGPQRPHADPGVRIRRDPAATWPRSSARSCRREPAGARRVPVLAVLADGQRALSGRRLRPLLCLCAGEDRIRDRPLRHGGRSASSTCSTGAWRTTAYLGRRRLHHRRHGDLALVWRRSRRAGSTTPASSCRCRNTRTSSLGRRDCRPAGGEARPHGQPRLRRALASSCTNATTPATSRRRRRTS